jgi:hypothetical protein
MSCPLNKIRAAPCLLKTVEGFTTTVAHGIDGGGSIAAGTLVDSHMIFLNSQDGYVFD